MELITLSMPVYNVEPYIERALLSALDQTYENIEFIIVDDKGNDRSMDVVRKVVATHPRGKEVKIIEHPVNIGLGGARNTAIDAANGEYLYFMDSDDEITPDCIRKLYDEMKRSDVDLVTGSTTFTKMNVGSVSNPSKMEVVVERNKKRMTNIFNVIYTWNRLYKLSFLRTNHIRCIPHHTIEDAYFTFQISVKAQSYSMIPDITYIYHQRSDSVSGGIWSEKIFKQFPQIFSDQLDAIKKEAFDPALRKKYKRKAFWFRVTISKSALNSPASARPYINRFLSSSYLNDRDTCTDGILFLGYMVSRMPLFIKIAFLRLHLFVYSRRK